MSRLGFNVVRLGMTWSGLEPGTAQANDPAICRKGAPGDPQQFNQAVIDAYLGNLQRTVDLLGSYGIYTILDMHQDVYNHLFDGEGAPSWAVCTDGVRLTDPPGRWSNSYASAAAGAAYRNFWTNDVVGNLQGEYDRVWATIAAYFRADPWVAGYDPFNEPFSTSLVTRGDEQFDSQLGCFYTGTRLASAPAHGVAPIPCPASDPALGVIPQIEAADPAHLVFYEPNIFSSRGRNNFVGAMNFPNLVFNFHIYCSQRSGKTGNPTDLAACASSESRALRLRSEDLTDLGTPAQPKGPAWFVSEFGASSSPALLGQLTSVMDRSLVGWAYWSWKFYGDPTGSSAEALLTDGGSLRSTARVLSRTYPEAIAGRPTSLSYSPSSGAFTLVFVPWHQVTAPTVIFVATQVQYPHGYCARAHGGRVISSPGATFLEVLNLDSAKRVKVSISSGSCRRG
jgi:endoglycosylceramidase